MTVVNETWNATVPVDGSTGFGLITLDGGTGRATEPLLCQVR